MRVFKKIFHRSCGVQTIVLNEKKMVLLLLRSDIPVWTLPGGHIDKGETALDAAKRELHEETGLTAESLLYLGIYEVKFLPLAGTTSVFLARGVKGTICLSDETRKIAYFPVERLPWNILPYIKRRIFQNIKTAI